jgi:hypothetical protein
MSTRHEGEEGKLRWSFSDAEKAGPVIPVMDPLHRKRDYPKTLRLPMVHETGASESCVCYTWQYGDAPWIQAFLPSVKQWVMRHKIELRVDSQPAVGKGLREVPYRQWMQDFLASEFEWMMALDADVMVHPMAPHVLQPGRERGLWACEVSFPAVREKAWRKWMQEVERAEVPGDFPYANDGVWMMDRKTAELLLPMTEGYAAGHVPLEYYFNWWRFKLGREHPELLGKLEGKWNWLPREEQMHEPAWMYHCAGRDKGAVMKGLQQNGFLPVPRPPMTFKPWPEAPEMEKLIAMPFRLEGDIWQGEMLRYTLRALEMYGPADWPLIVWGSERPEWLVEEVFRQEDTLQNTVLRSAALAEKILWMNDDILFLRPTSEAEFAEPVYLEEDTIAAIPQMMQQGNKWQIGCAVVAARLHHERGVDRLPNFSTHTPYLFHRKQLRKTIEYFGIWFKFPMELAYFGLLGAEGRPCREKAAMHELDDPNMRWFHVPDSAVEDENFRAWLERKFPRASRWEK